MTKADRWPRRGAWEVLSSYEFDKKHYVKSPTYRDLLTYLDASCWICATT